MQHVVMKISLGVWAPRGNEKTSVSKTLVISGEIGNVFLWLILESCPKRPSRQGFLSGAHIPAVVSAGCIPNPEGEQVTWGHSSLGSTSPGGAGSFFTVRERCHFSWLMGAYSAPPGFTRVVSAMSSKKKSDKIFQCLRQHPFILCILANIVWGDLIFKSLFLSNILMKSCFVWNRSNTLSLFWTVWLYVLWCLCQILHLRRGWLTRIWELLYLYFPSFLGQIQLNSNSIILTGHPHFRTFAHMCYASFCKFSLTYNLFSKCLN